MSLPKEKEKFRSKEKNKYEWLDAVSYTHLDVYKRQEKEGISIIPLKMYLKNNKAKLLIGIGKGKKLYDKRESIKKRDLEREAKQYY